MSSSSPRNRLNQIYATKKRKVISPISKAGRIEKGARLVADGSPSAKGSLESYLIPSQGEPIDEPVRPDLVRRKLATDIASYSLDNGLDKQPHATRTGFEKEVIVVGEPVQENKLSDFKHDGEKSELRQFKAELFSLYCGELQPSISSPLAARVKNHKRHDSLALVEENGTIPPKCDATSEPHFGRENILSNKVYNTMKSVPGCSAKASDGGDTNAFDIGFRKYSNTPTPMKMAECQTPGSLIVKACIKGTPKSTRGSSMFSPGEAFWDEAIQLADGLAVPMDNDSSKVIEENNMMVDQVEMNSCNLQNYDGKARKILDQSKNIGLSEMHTEDSMKEASSLPVRHFDFSYEDNNMDENTLQSCRVNNLVNVPSGSGKEYESIFVASHAYEQTYKLQEKILVDAVGKRAGKDNINLTSNNFNSPNNEARTTINIHTYVEAKTPSSHVSLDDHLDLHSWLPPEICNIYKKKGISKLYNWQVDCLRVNGVLQKRNLVYCASTRCYNCFNK